MTLRMASGGRVLPLAALLLAASLLAAPRQPALAAPGEALRIEEVRVSVLESRPLQVFLLLRGRRPADCAGPEARVAAPDAERRIHITLHGCEPAQDAATPEWRRFDLRVRVPMRGLAPGRYRLWLEGRELADLPYRGDPPAAAEGGSFAALSAALDVAGFVRMAEQAECAGDVNLLYVIDGEHVLWARADAGCADNGYGARLYTATPARLRCRYGDSIAGPRAACDEPALEALLRTAIRNLDRPDLGLGPQHRVRRLWAGFLGWR